jgi:hypothetical protein
MNLDSGNGIMAKKVGRPKTSDRADLSVKIDKRIVGKAKLIATHRGVSLAEFLSSLLSLPVDQAYAEMLKDLKVD